MTTTTFSVRLGRAIKSRLEKLAKNTGRSRSYLATEAISIYLDTKEWQVVGITNGSVAGPPRGAAPLVFERLMAGYVTL